MAMGDVMGDEIFNGTYSLIIVIIIIVIINITSNFIGYQVVRMENRIGHFMGDDDQYWVITSWHNYYVTLSTIEITLYNGW